MTTINRSESISSICELCADYIGAMTGSFNTDHVEKWISQFDRDSQDIILHEMAYILRRFYQSKKNIQGSIIKLLMHEPVFGKNPKESVKSTVFLNIQRHGSSQKDLIEITKDIVSTAWNIDITNPDPLSGQFIYMDDCLFSGNTVFYDIDEWVKKAPNNIRLHLFFLGIHTAGRDYVRKKLRETLNNKSISLEIFNIHEFENSRWSPTSFQCLWPLAFDDHHLTNELVSEVNSAYKDKCLSLSVFRPSPLSTDKIFSSAHNRGVVETQFTKYGSYICSLPEKRNQRMKPLGFELLESLGFGAFFITYRNIANNCPLVLWWGDPSCPDSHPFSKWYPLFPREVNEDNSNFGQISLDQFFNLDTF